MRTWNNVYVVNGHRVSACYVEDDTLETSDYYACLPHNAETWCARQERWNHHPVCPPVGMQRGMASHVWDAAVPEEAKKTLSDIFYTHCMKLEPRKVAELEVLP